MKKIVIFLLYSIMSSAVMAQLVDKNILKAIALIDNQKPDSALKVLSGFSEKPRTVIVSNIFGDCYYQKHEFSIACRYYLSVDSLSKGSGSYAIARCFAWLNKYPETMEWLSAYLAMPNKRSELEIVNDEAFFKLSQTLEWKELWKKSWYSDMEIERNAIKALIDKDRAEAAVNELESLEGKFSPRHEYFYLLALAYLKQNLLVPALDNANKALELYSQSDDYLALHADLMKETKKYAEGVEDLTKAIRLSPYKSIYYLKRGEMARLAGNYKLSSDDLLLYNEMYPASHEALFQLAMIEGDKGNYQNSMEIFDSLLTIDRSHANYFLERGKVGLKTKEISKADEDFGMSLDIDPSNPETNLAKGNTRLLLNDSPGACFYWERAKTHGNAEAAKLIYKYCRN